MESFFIGYLVKSLLITITDIAILQNVLIGPITQAMFKAIELVIVDLR